MGPGAGAGEGQASSAGVAGAVFGVMVGRLWESLSWTLEMGEARGLCTSSQLKDETSMVIKNSPKAFAQYTVANEHF